MKKLLVLLLTLVLSLSLLAGCSSETEEPETTTETTTESAAPIEGAFLTITVDGESTELTKADFESLEMVEHEISKTNNNDETTTAMYKGVQWPVLAAHLELDLDSTVLAVASDGYEVELTSDMLNDPQSMFALYEDGEPIESENGGEVWFCAGEAFTANNWAKFVVQLIVQ